jgi:hypothetical protein
MTTKQKVGVLIIAAASIAAAHAQERETIVATCSLVVNGESLWHGRCYVKPDANGPGALYATAHDYRCRSAGGPNKCTRAEACAGPWINIFREADESYSSYWNIENGCHGDPPVEHITKTGSGAYRGEGYIFTVK